MLIPRAPAGYAAAMAFWVAAALLLALTLVLLPIVVGLVTNRIDRQLSRLPWWLLACVIVVVAALVLWLEKTQVSSKSPAAAGPTYITPSAGRGGWGPARRTYTMEHPAAAPVMNSITDNPGWGDERNFVMVSNLTKVSTASNTPISACSGDVVQVLVGFFNDGASNLHDKVTLTGLRLSGVVQQDETATTVTMIISATNAGMVWSSGEVACAGRPVQVRFREGSGRAVFTKDAGGRPLLGDPFQSGGVPFGYERDDGTFPADRDSWGGWLELQLQVV